MGLNGSPLGQECFSLAPGRTRPGYFTMQHDPPEINSLHPSFLLTKNPSRESSTTSSQTHSVLSLTIKLLFGRHRRVLFTWRGVVEGHHPDQSPPPPNLGSSTDCTMVWEMTYCFCISNNVVPKRHTSGPVIQKRSLWLKNRVFLRE